MRSFTVLLVAICMLGGCRRDKAPAPVTGDMAGQQVQVRIGGAEDEPPHLSFRIHAVHANQTPLATPPYHRDGGNWTFMEIAPANEDKARVVVGVEAKGGFAKACIGAADPSAGAQFLSALAGAFQLKTPPPQPPGKPELIQFSMYGLGTDMDRQPGGGFSGSGKWTATKWFPSAEGMESEVYFNFNLASRMGEFSEKDQDYNQDVLLVLAMALRDGRPLERTPETDPTLSATGPTFQRVITLASKRARILNTGNTSALLAERKDKGETLVLVDMETGAIREITTVEHNIQGVQCEDQSAARCVIEESIPNTPGAISSDDPTRLWMLEQGELKAVKADGIGPRPNLATAALAPGATWIALHEWRKKAKGPGQYRRVLLVDRKSAKVAPVQEGEEDFDITGWHREGAALVAEIARGNPFDEKHPRSTWDFNLVDRKLMAARRVIPAASWETPRDALSPDGSYRCTASDTALTITDVKNAKTQVFNIHPTDLRYTKDMGCDWAGSRHLRLPLGRMAFLDVGSMKMSYPMKRDDDTSVTLTPDFRHALLTTGDGIELANVVLPGR